MWLLQGALPELRGMWVSEMSTYVYLVLVLAGMGLAGWIESLP